MRILVIHQNFPGQFGHLVKAWAQRPGWDVRALGRDKAPGLPGFDGLVRYSLARKGNANQHPSRVPDHDYLDGGAGDDCFVDRDGRLGPPERTNGWVANDHRFAEAA